MARLLLCIGFVLCFLAWSSKSQNIPRITCRIPWGTVDNTQFVTTWGENSGCASYNAFLLESYTRKIARRFENITGTRLEVPNLRRNTIYGMVVVCVNSGGQVGDQRLNTPCRTRTFGRTTTTTTPAPTAPVPVGTCGPGRFTCENGGCIDGELWCNREKECTDGTDERNCPGSCPPLQFTDQGNMTCSLFFSRGSSCFFDCETGFKRQGPRYTYCLLGAWTRATPSCLTVILDIFADGSGGGGRVAITIEVSQSVTRFELTSFTDAGGNAVNVDTLTLRIDRVTSLPPNQLIELTLSGVPTPTGNGVMVPIDTAGRRGFPEAFEVFSF